MASISLDKANGTYRGMFMGVSGKRGTLYLGKATKKQAETIKAHVEEIVSPSLAGVSMSRETAAWLGQLPDVIRAKLEGVGLVEPREKVADMPTIAVHVRDYIARRTDVRPNTFINLKRSESMLIEFVGAEKRIDEVTKAEAREANRRGH